MPKHQCEANKGAYEILYGCITNCWYFASAEWSIEVDYCPYCGVKLEKPGPDDDAELIRLREEKALWRGAEKRWYEQKKNLQGEVDRLRDHTTELLRLYEIEKVLLSDAGGWISSHEHVAGYFRHLAQQIQEQYPGASAHLRRIAAVIEKNPVPKIT